VTILNEQLEEFVLLIPTTLNYRVECHLLFACFGFFVPGTCKQEYLTCKRLATLIMAFLFNEAEKNMCGTQMIHAFRYCTGPVKPQMNEYSNVLA
jgi:hypothetical protein